ncbi:unnamed protein product [Trichogramma brassicae]|uniref:Reverse transcriptase domain-containing protein n=1 Tax=Trichogramma brassicae TaxID=86971 RepID=A0A6H5IYP5_9HYME|nr:unnamed protein product [Trichogramma brassicae]
MTTQVVHFGSSRPSHNKFNFLKKVIATFNFNLDVNSLTYCKAPEDRSSLTSHSSAPASRASSPSPSHFASSTERSTSLESLSLKRPRDSPPTALCVKRTNVQLTESVPPVSPCLPGPPNDMSDDGTPPPWVSTLLSRFDRLESSMNGRLTSIETSLLEFSRTQHQHTASIEHNTNRIAGLDERVTAEIAIIRSDSDRAFTAMRAEIGRACVQSRAAAAAPVGDLDTCEVRVSGIPLSVDVTSSATAERIVSALELDRLRPHILSVREWAPRRRTPVTAPSTSNAALDLEMKTMVIRFSSANARETFLAAAPKFQRLPVQTIFGIADGGRATHLRANVILPSDRHRLYRRCAAAAETHGYPRPFVRNLCIYMRRARDSAPMRITSDDDLALLVSRPNETLTSVRPNNQLAHCQPGQSLLAELSKIVERLAHAQLSDHLSRHSLLDPQQHGFRPGHSTQTALLDLTESVRMAVDKRKITALVSFDFSKAFDTIDHGLLISKLRRLGCDALAVEWFSSYLSNRCMSVKSEDGALSDSLFTTSGIPQGSSLGPLLFAIFINDLHTALRHSKHIIYADDTAIFQHHFSSKIHELIADLNADANAVAAWAAENKLHLNPSKTTVMILGSLAYVSSIDKAAIPKITLNGTSIAYSSSIKCLGVTISPTLLWTKHINSLRSKCHFALYSLRFYRHALNRQLRTRLAVAPSLAHLDYAAAVYNDISATSDLKLQRLQNACVRFVFASIPAREHLHQAFTIYKFVVVHAKKYYNYLRQEIEINILDGAIIKKGPEHFQYAELIEPLIELNKIPTMEKDTIIKHNITIMQSLRQSRGRVGNNLTSARCASI